MRTMLSTIVLAAGLGLAGVSNAAAAPVGSGVRSTDVLESVAENVHYRRGRYCERLRRACVYKEYRGEVGEGNCRRYRSECGGRRYW
jgi:hypothetical protein